MERIKTGVKCRVCQTGEVEAVIDQVQIRFDLDMIIGGQNYREEITFSCGNEDCAVSYRHPPSRPNAVSEIFAERSRLKELVKSRPIREALESATRELLIKSMLDKMRPIPENASEETKKSLEVEREEIVRGTEWRTMPLDQLKRLSRMEIPPT